MAEGWASPSRPESYERGEGPQHQPEPQPRRAPPAGPGHLAPAHHADPRPAEPAAPQPLLPPWPPLTLRGLVLAARAAPQASPQESRNRGASGAPAQPFALQPRPPPGRPARPRRWGRCWRSASSWAGCAGARRAPSSPESTATAGWTCRATTTRVSSARRTSTRWTPPSAAAPALCATAAPRPTPGWSRAAALTTAASWSTRASRRVSTGPGRGRPCPAGLPCVPAGARAKRRARPSRVCAKGTLESGGIKGEVGGRDSGQGRSFFAVPIPATRGLRGSAQELVRHGPRGPRGLHPVTLGEKEGALGAHDISEKGCGGRARLDLSFLGW